MSLDFLSRVRSAVCLTGALLAASSASAATFQVTNNLDSGNGSLRKAIADAELTAAADTITFAIGTGAQSITLLTVLPTITHPLTIDGTTQPGFAGAPLIELNGAAVVGNGLNITGGSSTVKSLVINRFQGNGIQLSSSGNTVVGCYIGTNAAGTAALGNTASGINVSSSANTIGGLTAAERNVISGNANYGILVFSMTIMSGTIRGNYIGTNAAGTAAIPNAQGGVRVSNASSVTIGGTTAAARNVISGNSGSGVGIDGTGGGNAVLGNYIGTDVTGALAVPNNGGVGVSAPNTLIGTTAAGAGNVISGNAFNGIVLSAGGNGCSIKGNLVGTNAAGTAALPNQQSGIRAIAVTNVTIGDLTAAGRNVVSGNASGGISVEDAASTGAVVLGNYVGLNAAGTAALPNGGSGITAGGTNGAVIGGNVAAAANVVSGNAFQGVVITGGAAGTIVQGNFIGTNPAGTAAIPNASGGLRDVNGVGTAVVSNLISGNAFNAIAADATASGLLVRGNLIGTNAAGTAALPNGGGVSVGAPGSVVGGTVAGTRNIISGNTGTGVVLSGNNISVQGNHIGTNVAGTAKIANSQGLRILSGTGALIGGTVAGAGNVISGNTNEGIVLDGGVSGATIQGNFIGTDVTGALALGNAGGIGISGANNIVGGSVAAARNVISGNTGTNLSMFGAGATGNVVQGNYIGLNAAGTAAVVTNSNIGVRIITANGNTVGGTTAGARNVISGNYRGLTLEFGATGNVVQGNYIGTNAAGTSAVPNAEEGVAVGGPDNTIGGTAAGAGNVISGNTAGYGVWIQSVEASGTKVWGNLIGTRPDGTTPLPNIIGVLVSAGFGNEIGGTAAGQPNVVAGNSFEGVRVQSGNGNAILGNSLFSNTVMGLDLEVGGVATNDPMDPDTGANLQQNYPLLSSVIAAGGNTTILGTLKSNPNTSFRVEFYGSPACHPSGMGEGRTFLGFATVNTDASGNGTINSVLPVAAPGAFVSGTATGPVSGTSEYSPCAAVGGPNPGVFRVALAGIVATEADGTVPVVVTRSQGMAGTVTVQYTTSNGSAVAPSDYQLTAGQLTFADGEVVKTVPVPVFLDADPEGQQNFFFTLSTPGGGATLGAQIVSTITLNDVTLAFPAVAISDVTLTEGNAGTKNATFTITVSPHVATMTIGWNTQDGSATAGSDYTAASGNLQFLPAELSKTVDVVVQGDLALEGDESFFVVINQILPGGFVTKGTGEAVITNDDSSVTVSSISKPCASTTGGLPLTIQGAGFQAGATVTLVGTPAVVNNVTPTQISVTTAARMPTTPALGDVVVTNPDLTTGTLPNGFTYALRGDANGNGAVTGADTFFLNLAIFLGGAQPPGLCSGDANSSGAITGADAFFMNLYIFLGGTAPGP
ncbi:MAG: IPT/TIG domain-containing protein [Acidobacteria bacterium]|nr:IPT/TIG domain-containing protein [Acidobacteriota bacterium]